MFYLIIFYVNLLKRRKMLFGRNLQNFSRIGCVYGYKQETVASVNFGEGVEKMELSDTVAASGDLI